MRGKTLEFGNLIEFDKDVYELTIKMMHGDGDADTWLTLAFNGGLYGGSVKEGNLLLATVDVLDQMINTSGFRNYNEVQGFKELLSDNWDTDATCEDYLAEVRSYQITYADRFGQLHEVHVGNIGW